MSKDQHYREFDVDEEAPPKRGQFSGRHLSADQFWELPESESRYELINGVVVEAPSVPPIHQAVAGEISFQIYGYLRSVRRGHVFYGMNALFHRGNGLEGDFVYRPDIVFFRPERRITSDAPLMVRPDLCVEVISCDTRVLDTIQKRSDYERFGVSEYWIVDPLIQSLAFLRLVDRNYVEMPPTDDTFESHAIPGFVLQLAPIREEFKPW